MHLSTKAEQFGRVIRLFVITWCNFAWIHLLGVQWPTEATVLGICVGACEAIYRLFEPRVTQAIAEQQAAHLKQIVREATQTETPEAPPPPVVFKPKDKP